MKYLDLSFRSAELSTLASKGGSLALALAMLGNISCAALGSSSDTGEVLSAQSVPVPAGPEGVLIAATTSLQTCNQLLNFSSVCPTLIQSNPIGSPRDINAQIILQNFPTTFVQNIPDRDQTLETYAQTLMQVAGTNSQVDVSTIQQTYLRNLQFYANSSGFVSAADVKAQINPLLGGASVQETTLSLAEADQALLTNLQSSTQALNQTLSTFATQHSAAVSFENPTLHALTINNIDVSKTVTLKLVSNDATQTPVGSVIVNLLQDGTEEVSGFVVENLWINNEVNNKASVSVLADSQIQVISLDELLSEELLLMTKGKSTKRSPSQLAGASSFGGDCFKAAIASVPLAIIAFALIVGARGGAIPEWPLNFLFIRGTLPAGVNVIGRW